MLESTFKLPDIDTGLDLAPSDRRRPQTRRLTEIIIFYIIVFSAVFIVFFKFSPDVGFAYFFNAQHGCVGLCKTTLEDFGAFKGYDLTQNGDVHYARFLGNELVYYLAIVIDYVLKTTDPRLHPLRISAAIWSCFFLLLGTIFQTRADGFINWKVFFVLYSFVCLVGMYVYYPADMPSVALISLCLYFMQDQRFGLTLGAMIIAGLFRESAFHVVVLVCVWAVCQSERRLLERIGFIFLFAAVFFVEYKVIRLFFPGRLSDAGGAFGIDFSISNILFAKGLWSLTSMGVLAIDFSLILYYIIYAMDQTDRSWQRRFYLTNCLLFPCWILFYRMLAGNVNEFRLLIPALLPVIFGIAHNASLEAGSMRDRNLPVRPERTPSMQ